MNVGTISLNINVPDFNYGAILHSWAFQQYLKKLECVEYTEVIDYTMPSLEGQNLKYPIWASVVGIHPRLLMYHLKNHNMYQRRFRKFERFINTYICKSNKKYTQSTLNVANLDYDCVICESDVIWAPGFSGGHFDRSFFLALDSMREMKRIAYAPSMANGDLTPKQEDELRELLTYVDCISCRESYEKDILEKYTEKSVAHVLDPVMLLSEADYKPIIADRLSDRKYILLYLPVDDNDKLRQHAILYAKKYNLDIIEISTKLCAKEFKGYKCIGEAGIEEFLSGIKYAECVFTNSFHAICFSAIFHKNFYAFSRAYAGKVKDICKVLGLQDYYFPNDVFIEREPIEYASVDARIIEMKEKSETWLRQALELGGGRKRNIVLVGLIFDSNLGDQAIYYSTKAMLKSLIDKYDMGFEIRSIDLYGREQPERHEENSSIFHSLWRKICYEWSYRDTEREICTSVTSICDKVFDKNTAGVIFVGGGLLKYKNQIISAPMQIILHSTEKRRIPVMLSGVGVEGFDRNDESCMKLVEALNFDNVKIVTTRDNIDLLREKWIRRDNIITEQVADPAVSLSKYIQPNIHYRRNAVIGLGIGRAGLFEDYGINIPNKKIKELWVSLFEALSRCGYECVLFTNGLHADFEFAQEVMIEIHKHGHPEAICLNEPHSTQELVNMISSFTGMIVTRLHGSIIGYSYDVPSISLVWNEKQRMFGEIIGYSERFVQAEDFTVDLVVGKLERAMREGFKKDYKYALSTEKFIEKFFNDFLR